MESPYASYNALKTIGIYYPRPDMSVPAGPFVTPKQDANPSYLFDYNDPLAVNSVVDILFNEAALNKHYAQPNDVIGQIDAADFQQRIIATLDLFKRSAIDPTAGRVSKATKPSEFIDGIAAGLGDTLQNTLMNFGETMDIAANPIKGAILEKEGPAKGFMRGLGTTEEGRYNYDYDVQTGFGPTNFIANMALEIISDPLNWVSLGSKAIASVGAKALVSISDDLLQETAEQALRRNALRAAEHARRLGDLQTTKKVVDTVIPAFTREARERLAKQIARNVANNPGDVSKAVVNTVKSSRIPDFYKLAFGDADGVLSKALTKYTSEHLLYTVVKGLNNVDAVLDQFQKGLLYSTLATGLGSIIPPSVLRGKLAEIFVAAANRAKLALPNAEAPNKIITFDAYDDEIMRMKVELMPLELQSAELAGLSEVLPQNIFLSGQKDYLSEVSAYFQKYAQDIKHKPARAAYIALQDGLNKYHRGITKDAYDFSSYVDLAVAKGTNVPAIQNIANTLVSLRDTLNIIGQLQSPKHAAGLMKSFGETQDYVSDMFSKSLNPLLDPERAKYFQKLSTPQRTSIKIDLRKAKEYVVYTAKEAQAYAYAQLLKAQSEVLGTLIKDIYTGTGVMRGFATYAESNPEVATFIEQLEIAAQGHVAQMQFMQACLANTETRAIFPRVFDAMQTYASTPLSTILKGNYRNTNYYIEKIIEKANLQLAELSNKGHNLKLDYLFSNAERFAAFKEWAASAYPTVPFTRMHDALQDSIATEYMFHDPSLLAEYAHLIDPVTHTSVFLDFETTGLNSAVDQILQVGITVNGEVYDWRAVTEAMYKPSTTVMALLSGSKDPLVQKQFFSENYGLEAPESVLSEGQVIKQVHDLLKNLAMSGKPVQIVGQNIDYFDREFLFRRALEASEHTTAAAHLRSYPTVDTLKLLRDKFNIQTLSAIQSSAVRAQLSQYLFARRAEIMSIGGTRKFINGFDGAVISSLEKLLDVDYADLLNSLEPLRASVVSVLKDLKLANIKLAEQAIFYDPINKSILNKLGEAVAPSGLMSITRLTGDDVEGFISHSFKKQFDTRVHRKYFPVRNIRDARDITESSLIKQEYNIAVTLERKVQRIRDIKTLTKYHYSLVRYATELLPYISASVGGLQHLKIKELSTPQIIATVELLEDYAALIKKQTGITQFTEHIVKSERYSDDFRDIVYHNLQRSVGLAQESAFEKTNFTPDEIQTTTLFQVGESRDLINRSDLDLDMELFRIRAERMLDDCSSIKQDVLEELSRDRERYNLFSPTAQAESAILENLIHAIRNFENYTQMPEGPAFKKVYEEAARFVNTYGDDYGNAGVLAVTKFMEADLPNFKRHLFMHAQGYITFRIPTPNASVSFTKDAANTLLHTCKNAFLQRADELLAHGIHVTYDDFTGRLWVVLDDKHFDEYLAEEKRILEYREKFNKYPDDVSFPVLKKHIIETSFPEQHWGHSEDVRKLFRVTEHYMHTLTRGESLGSLGDTLAYENLEDIYKNLPESLRADAVHPSKFKAVAQHFDRVIFNHSNIGPITSRKDIMPMTSRNVFKNYANTIQHMVHRFDDRMKLTYLFFDPAQSLKGPYYKTLSDADLFEIVQKHPEYTIAGLKKHPKYGLIVQEYKAPSIAELRRLRADPSVMLMPTQTFLKAWHVINDFKIGNNASALLRKFVISPTKTGYLMTTGWLVRNLVDSYIKNVVLTGSFAEAGGMLRHTLETAKLYSTYKRTLEGIYKEAQLKYGAGSKEVFSRKIASDYLKTQNLISEEDFFTVHNFVEQGPSAGISKEQQRLLQMRHERKTGKKDSYNLLYDNKYTTFIMDTNSEIEQIMRLSGYTWALDQGETIDAAMGLVKKNHFDYTVKTPAMLYAEYVVPFLSFTVNNTAFWLDSFDKDPWLASIFRDTMTPVWNFDEYSSMELNNNRSLQYHILAGNIVDPDTNLVFKLNPSIMDAIKLLTDPTEWYERILPVVRLPVEILAAHMAFDPEADTYETEAQTIMRKVLENIPYAGPTIQRYWGADLEAMFTGKADAPTGEDYRYRGSVQKGLERVTTAAQLTAFMPSLFGGVQRNYYFAYGDGQVFMTHSPEKLSNNLKKGAIEIYAKDDPRVVSAFRRWAQKSYPTKLRMVYPNKGSRVRKPYVKKFRAKRSYFKKYYPPKQYATNVQARIRKFVRGSQFRMPGSFRNTSNPAPTIYKRLYTAKGTARFKQRMVPVTASNLAAKLRSDWYYLRG